MAAKDCDKFVLGRITAYVVHSGGTALVRVFDDNASPVLALDDVPKADVPAILEDWMVEKTFEWRQ